MELRALFNDSMGFELIERRMRNPFIGISHTILISVFATCLCWTCIVIEGFSAESVAKLIFSIGLVYLSIVFLIGLVILRPNQTSLISSLQGENNPSA